MPDDDFKNYMSINNYQIKPHVCPVCGGTGTVMAHFYAEYRGSSISGEVQCKSCGGQGIIWG